MAPVVSRRGLNPSRGGRKRTRRELASFGVMGMRVAEFLEARRTRHFSPRTVEWNENELRFFLGWCEERSLHNPTEITRPILERYQRWLYYYRKRGGQPLSIATQHKRLAGVLAFFRWMAKANLVLFNRVQIRRATEILEDFVNLGRRRGDLQGTYGLFTLIDHPGGPSPCRWKHARATLRTPSLNPVATLMI